MGLITNATSGLITSVNNRFDSITGVAKGLLCIPQILSPDGLKYITSQILGYIGARAAGVVLGLTHLVTTIVTRAVNQITGRIGAELAAINALLKDINEAITLIKTYLGLLDDKAKAALDFLKDQENCKFAAAELGKCIVGDIIDQMTNKYAKDLNTGVRDLGTEVNNITNSIVDPNHSVAKYVQRTQFNAAKAIIHLSI